MQRRIAVLMAAVMSVMALAGTAQGQDKLQKHFNDVASEVKATDNPAQKRELLEQKLEKMAKALDEVQSSPLVSKDDKAGIAQVKTMIKDKQDELAGVNGYDRVPDAQLNAFADYVVQDMEQADQMVSISVVTLLLIIIIVILVA